MALSLMTGNVPEVEVGWRGAESLAGPPNTVPQNLRHVVQPQEACSSPGGLGLSSSFISVTQVAWGSPLRSLRPSGCPRHSVDHSGLSLSPLHCPPTSWNCSMLIVRHREK